MRQDRAYIIMTTTSYFHSIRHSYKRSVDMLLNVSAVEENAVKCKLTLLQTHLRFHSKIIRMFQHILIVQSC